jgi:hypothetical protein
MKFAKKSVSTNATQTFRRIFISAINDVLDKVKALCSGRGRLYYQTLLQVEEVLVRVGNPFVPNVPKPKT